MASDNLLRTDDEVMGLLRNKMRPRETYNDVLRRLLYLDKHGHKHNEWACSNCEYQWQSRIGKQKPRSCPRCKRYEFITALEAK